MNLCRFNENRLGVVKEDSILDVTEVLEGLPSFRYPAPQHDSMIANLETLIPAIKIAAASANAIPLKDVVLLSPIANPTKLIAAPVNYKKHVEESQLDAEIHHNQHLAKIQQVALFLKANSALVGSGEGVKLRHLDRRTDHELELALIIGKTANQVSAEDALDYVAGYSIGLDMTVRGPEERSFRKSIDSYAVLGPWLVTADSIEDPSNLQMELSVNGEMRQSANTKDLIISIPELIAWASSFYTLHPGDVIYTGTPDGVAPVKPGDTIKASIQGIGAMEVSVGAAE